MNLTERKNAVEILKNSEPAEIFCQIITEKLMAEKAVLESVLLDFPATQSCRGAIKAYRELLHTMGREA